MGLGGWMLQEPYMLDMSGFAGTQWQIKEKIETLIGTINTEAFYDKWRANHCTRRDIDSLASWDLILSVYPCIITCSPCL